MSTLLVVNSGGLDSAVALAVVHRRFPAASLHSLYVNFGHRSAKRELSAARRLAQHYGAKHHVSALSMPWFRDHPLWSPKYASVALTSPFWKECAEAGAEGRAEMFIVAQRNLVIVSVASALAHVVGAEKIYVGWDYFLGCKAADKSPKFRHAFDNAAEEASPSGSRIPVVSVLDSGWKVCRSQEAKKLDAVRLAVKLRVPVTKTWSCYNNFSLPCGVCEPCVHRASAYKKLKLREPGRRLSMTRVRELIHT